MATTGNIQGKKKNNALFPDFPRGTQITEPTRFLTKRWNLALSSLFQSLQRYFSAEGILIPSLTSDELASIAAQYDPIYIGKMLPAGVEDISGQMVFDKTSGQRVPKVFVITYNADKTVATASWKTFTIT